MSRPSELAQLPVIEAPVVYANDYDGVQGITGECPPLEDPQQAVEGAMGYLLYLAEQPEFGLDRDNLVNEWRLAELNGSFAPTDELRKQLTAKQLGAQAFTNFMDRYGRNEDNFPLTYADTEAYHARMAGANGEMPVANFSLTWGLEEWQVPKTRASNVPGHIEITDIKSKGKFMDKMRNDATKRYDLVAVSSSDEGVPMVSAKTMTLVDDKPASFDALPINCRGIYVKRPNEKAKVSKQGSVDPLLIDNVQSLDEIKFTPGMRIDPKARDLLPEDVRFVPLVSYLLAS